MTELNLNENTFDLLSYYGALSAFIGLFGLLTFVYGIILIVSTWKIYQKAGKPGWASIIPIYNVVALLQITELPLWYFMLLLIPFVNFFIIIKIYIKLAHKFGKSTLFGIATIFFGFICLPILAFSKNTICVNKTLSEIKKQEVKINNLETKDLSQPQNNDVIPQSQTPVGIGMQNNNNNIEETRIIPTQNINYTNNPGINNNMTQSVEINKPTMTQQPQVQNNTNEENYFVYNPNRNKQSQPVNNTEIQNNNNNNPII